MYLVLLQSVSLLVLPSIGHWAKNLHCCCCCGCCGRVVRLVERTGLTTTVEAGRLTALMVSSTLQGGREREVGN